MKKTTTLICSLMSALCAMSAPALLPIPKSVKMTKGSYSLNKGTSAMRCDTLVMPAIEDATARALKEEAYKLRVTPDSIVIQAYTPIGFLRAQQTLDQLSDYGKGKSIPCCEIEDEPTYRWRGVMLDLSRQFFPLEHVYKQIDVLAKFKVNKLHLHLTDAAGWRMEIKRYPRLTSLAAFRTDDSWKVWWNDGKRAYAEEGTPQAHGGYYTQDELRALVDYAAKKGITIIPEIEMPAHSEEVLTAYPELSCTHEPYKQADFCPGSVATYDFLEHVLEEVMDVFPSEYIHVGGDEAGMASWPDCPLCQQKMKEEGMTETAELQAYLIAHMNDFLASHGRKLIGWDEVLEGEKPCDNPATMMIWRGQGKAAEAMEGNHDIILCPGSHCYFDNAQDAPQYQPEAGGGYLPLEKVYAYNPESELTKEETKHILGLQGNLWAEYIPTREHAEMMLYPRALALAEIGWSGAGLPYPDFRKRAEAQNAILRANGVEAFDLTKEMGQRKEMYTLIKHKGLGCPVTYVAPYSEQYEAAGDATLTDGKRGGWANNDGLWQGFITRGGLDVVVDLQKVQKISNVKVDFQQICNPWIFYPEHFAVSVSADGENFTEVYNRKRPFEESGIPTIDTWEWKGKPTEARYVRVEARMETKHGWIFTDEIIIN